MRSAVPVYDKNTRLNTQTHPNVGLSKSESNKFQTLHSECCCFGRSLLQEETKTKDIFPVVAPHPPLLSFSKRAGPRSRQPKQQKSADDETIMHTAVVTAVGGLSNWKSANAGIVPVNSSAQTELAVNVLLTVLAPVV